MFSTLPYCIISPRIHLHLCPWILHEFTLVKLYLHHLSNQFRVDSRFLHIHTNPPLTDFFMFISEAVYYSRCLIIFECVLVCVVNCLCSVVTGNCTFAPRTLSSLITDRKLISHFRQVLWSLWNATSIQLTTQTHSEPHAAVSILLQRSLATPAKTSHRTL